MMASVKVSEMPELGTKPWIGLEPVVVRLGRERRSKY